jgi:hypothetical protein
MKGFGTDEKALIRILCNKDPLQMAAIKDAYSRNHRRDLVSDIKSEVSGWFETGLVALVNGPLMHDVNLLHGAMSGPGTKEKVLNDVLLGRSNADIQAIKAAYNRTHRRNLEDAVRGDLSFKTERHFMMVLQATRAEDAAPVVKADIDRDVIELYNATEAKMGTDEMKVCSILTTRNDNQIRAIAHDYQQKYARSLEDVIRKVCITLMNTPRPRDEREHMLTARPGVLGPHGRRTPLPAPSRHGQVHAPGGAAGGRNGRCRYQRPPAGEPGGARTLGSAEHGQCEGRVREALQDRPGASDQGRDERGLRAADAGLHRRADLRVSGWRATCIRCLSRGDGGTRLVSAAVCWTGWHGCLCAAYCVTCTGKESNDVMLTAGPRVESGCCRDDQRSMEELFRKEIESHMLEQTFVKTQNKPSFTQIFAR